MILLVRPDHNEADEKALRAAGFQTLIRPILQVLLPADPTPAKKLAAKMAKGGTLFLTSPRTWGLWEKSVPELGKALSAGLNKGLQIWTVGARTAASLPPSAKKIVHTGAGISAADLLAELANQPAGTALLPQSALARPTLAWGLGLRGWQVHTAEVYSLVPISNPELPEESEIDGVILRSPSAVKALSEHLTPGAVKAFTVGPTTTEAALELGWNPVVVENTSPEAVAKAVGAAH